MRIWIEWAIFPVTIPCTISELLVVVCVVFILVPHHIPFVSFTFFFLNLVIQLNRMIRRMILLKKENDKRRKKKNRKNLSLERGAKEPKGACSKYQKEKGYFVLNHSGVCRRLWSCLNIIHRAICAFKIILNWQVSA